MKPEDLDQDPGDTFIDKMLKNTEVFKAMLTMPSSYNEALPERRRKEMFSFIWEKEIMEKRETLEHIKEHEETYMKTLEEDCKIEHLNDLPEWMLRCEAQSLVLKFMYEEFVEEDLI